MLQRDDLVIIDLSQKDVYQRYHLPGAIHLSYQHVIHGQIPAIGELPSTERLQALIDALGITPDTHVLMYDEEGNSKASRFLWTLDVIGHHHYSLLNGGIQSWVNEGHPTSQQAHRPQPKRGKICMTTTPLADKDYIKSILGSDEHILLDSRTEAEYNGRCGGLIKGHIPGAIHFNWLDAIDQNNNMRFYADDRLNEKFEKIGLNKNKEIIAYCRTHYRSSHTYAVLKHLGYPRIKGYAGSWAEWGSDPTLPFA